MLIQKFLSRKKLSRKNRSIFGLKNLSCDRRNSTSIAGVPFDSVGRFPSNRKNWRLGKIGDSGTKPVILKNCRWLQAPRNSGRDNAVGIIMIWWTRLPLILQIHSPHQIATGTLSHVSPRRRGIIIAIFHDFGINCMVPQDWDSGPRCVCGPNFISDLIGESPFFWLLGMQRIHLENVGTIKTKTAKILIDKMGNREIALAWKLVMWA